VGVRIVAQQQAARLEIRDDQRVRLENVNALQPLRSDLRGNVGAVVGDGVERGQSVDLPHPEIVGAVAGRGMHASGAGVERDVRAEHEHARLVRVGPRDGSLGAQPHRYPRRRAPCL
jgi:hypothetical protein